MRMLNQDAQYMQELATSRRFAHAVGTCYVAYQICRRSSISPEARLTFLAAALIQDIGILPYGHLVEREFARLDHSFSHENLVREILYGTYHTTNVYHQLLPGVSLEVATILNRYRVNQEAVLDLIRPESSRPTAVSAPLDVDNIDNVHRMAALLGYPDVATNVRSLVSSLRLDTSLELRLDRAGLRAVGVWLEYRRTIYSQMIGHPECVAYNAFLRDLVRKAIEVNVIRSDEWYLSDLDFESRLLQDTRTKEFAQQLRTGCRYRLLDYCWLEFVCSGSNSVSPELAESLLEGLPQPSVDGAVCTLWYERNKISRQLQFRLTEGGDPHVLGAPSLVVLIAMIDPGVVPETRLARFLSAHGRQTWRKQVISTLEDVGMMDGARLYYPEDQVWKGVVERDKGEQLRLF